MRIAIIIALILNAAAQAASPSLCAETARQTRSDKVSPSFLEADFDGDGKPDVAVLVRRGKDQGIVVCRGNDAPPIVLGAGTTFNDMRNLDFTSWKIHAKNRKVALLLEWAESGSAIVYWNGSKFVWYQQGD